MSIDPTNADLRQQIAGLADMLLRMEQRLTCAPAVEYECTPCSAATA